MTFKPVQDRILVLPVDKESQTSSGLFVLSDDSDQPNKGKVLSVGEGTVTKTGVLVPLTIKQDDTVLWTKGSGQKVRIEGTDYVILKESEVLGVLEHA